MTTHITSLELDAFERLPKHARRCVFWEVDPQTIGAVGHLADPEFEKEAWLSMVMLEWGSCGQVAAPTGAPAGGSTPESSCVGYALYAPPRTVPRAHTFPTGPVSPDAVLLTTLAIEPGQDAATLPGELIARVVADLVRRGVRALEAFGRTADAHRLVDPAAVTPELRDVVAPLGDCSYEQCVIDADFLTDTGFTVVAPHRYFPRLRIELNQGLGWKADVEAALERLLRSAELAPVGSAAPAAVCDATGGQGAKPPARSTADSWASSSAKVKVPVGRSFLPSR